MGRKLKLNITKHWIELKLRLLYLLFSFISTFLICFNYKIEVFYFISKLFLIYEKGFIYTSLLDPFVVFLKLSFFTTILFILPLSIYLIGFFFIKSYYTIITRVIISVLLFYYFMIFFLFIIWYNFFFHVLLHFFISYQRENLNEVMTISLEATLPKYLILFFYFVYIYLIMIFLPFIIIFILFYLNKTYILTKFYFRKYLYLLVFFCFLFVAPPDFMIQLFFMPFIILFIEILIYLITFFYVLYNYYFITKKFME